MSIVLDYAYINQISARLEQFKWIRTRLAVCRCPICGDSAKKKSKKRFYIYQDTKHIGVNWLSVACQNCGYTNPFGKFLEEFDSSLYQQYRLELFKELGYKTRPEPEKKIEANVDRLISKLLVKKPILEGCIPVSQLAPDHHCRAYVAKRMIPEEHYSNLWFTPNFKESIRLFNALTYNSAPNDDRLVIPFFDENNDLICVQGRALSSKTEIRYFTVKKNDESKKIFGLDRINKNKPVLVVEGPIDSLFLPNCIATADANLLAADIGDVLIPDCQYRNKEVCAYIEKFIDSGKKVVLFPHGTVHKDINDMVEKGGMTRGQLLHLIASNVYSGLKAKLVFGSLKKV